MIMGALVMALLAQFVTLPYVLLRPGPAVDILGTPEEGAPVVTIEGAETYPTEGALYFTTVAQYGGPGRRPTAWDVARAALDPHSDVVPEERIFPPDVTREQMQERQSAMMTDSKEEAVAVALRALGRDVTETAQVAQVMPDMPAQGRLEVNDIITAVDGEDVTRAPQIAERITASTSDVTLTVIRGDETLQVELSPRERDGRRLVGVLIQPRFEYGVDVQIQAGNVGGPSAGMMFALGVYDTLTPGALTGGEQIAGTGSIDSTGQVGAIGGVPQKLTGARDAGASFFLTPRDNCHEVPGNVPDGLTVTPVTTFEESVAAVEAIASGDSADLPRCPGT
ncbi:MAG: S16 family serine protease [Mobilicoccus sp.]|nr:S16 family serine protease [Mobilicoccus sp.]